jgi:hypothetical protein
MWSRSFDWLYHQSADLRLPLENKMSPKFIGERISVTTGGTIRQPSTFTWKDVEYRVTEVILSWMDWGFPQSATQRDWKARRHRNYYRVRTDRGEVYEIYHDRGPGGRGGGWYLFQQMD